MAKQKTQNTKLKPKPNLGKGSIVNKGGAKGRTTSLPTFQLNNKPKKK